MGHGRIDSSGFAWKGSILLKALFFRPKDARLKPGPVQAPWAWRQKTQNIKPIMPMSTPKEHQALLGSNTKWLRPALKTGTAKPRDCRNELRTAFGIFLNIEGVK